MPGLLDFLNTPESALGIGLLAAAGSGQGFGPGLLSASQYASQVRQQGKKNQWEDEDRALEKRYRDAQIQELQRKADKDQRMQGLLGNLLGGGSLPGVAGPNEPVSQQNGRQGGNLANLTADQIAALKIAGTDLTDIWKEARPSYQVQNGYAYDPRTVGAGFLPGVQVSNDGRATVIRPSADRGALEVQLPRGAAEAFGTYRGIDAGITAANTPERVFNPQTQREEIVPRSQVLRGNMTGPGYAGGSSNAAATDQIRIIQSELDRLPPNHPDRPAVMRELQRLGGQVQSGNYAAGPSAAEQAQNEAARVSAVDTAKANVVRDTGRQSENKRASQLNSGIDRAIQLLNSGPTASVLGTAADKGLGMLGVSTPGGETAAQLEALSGWLVSNVPRMEGPQSNVDVQNYQTMAGRVGNSSLPIGTRIKAAEEVKRLQEKYSEMNGAQPMQPQSRPASMPMKGQLVQGYRFKGGDPANQANWEKQ